MANPNNNWTYHACGSQDLATNLARKTHKSFFLSNRENGFGNTRVTIPILQTNQDYQSDISLVKKSMDDNPYSPHIWTSYADLKYCVDLFKTNNNVLIRDGGSGNTQPSALWSISLSNETNIPITTQSNQNDLALAKRMLMDTLSYLYDCCLKSMALSLDSVTFVKNPENKTKPLANLQRTYKLTMKVLSDEVKALLESPLSSDFFKGFLNFIRTRKIREIRPIDFLGYIENYVNSLNSTKMDFFVTKTFKLKASDLMGNKLIQHRFDIKECFGYFHIAEGKISNPNVIEDRTNVVGFGFSNIPSDISPIFNKNDVQIYPLVQPQVNTYDANNIVNKNNACNGLTWLNGCSLFTRTPTYNSTNEFDNTLLFRTPYSNGLLSVDFNNDQWNYNLKGFFPMTTDGEFQNLKINASSVVGQSIPSCYVKASLVFDANELCKEMIGQGLNSLLFMSYTQDQKIVRLSNINQKPKYISIELERFFDLLDYKIDLIEKPQSFQATMQANTFQMRMQLDDSLIATPQIKTPKLEMVSMSADIDDDNYSMYNPPIQKKPLDDSKNLLWLYLLGLGSIMGYSYWRYYKKTKAKNLPKQ